MYTYGQGVKEDLKKANDLFTISCSGDSPLGCTLLGYAFKEGIGTKIDLNKAKEHFKKACELNDEEGCTMYKQLSK